MPVTGVIELARPAISGIELLTDEQWEQLRMKLAEVMTLGCYVTLRKLEHFHPGEDGQWLVARVTVDGQPESWDWMFSLSEWWR